MKIQSTGNLKATAASLVYGPSGCGKTRLALTAPNPIIFDFDDGLASIKEGNLPFYGCRSWKDGLEAFNWIIKSEEVKKYGCVFLDDFTEAAEQLLAAERPKHTNLMQAYGVLNNELMKWIRLLRESPVPIVFLCKQDRNKDDLTGGMIYGPMIPGRAIPLQLPYLLGEVYHMEEWVDPKDQARYEVLRCKRDAANQFDAKSRSGKLAEIELANMTNIFTKVLS